MTNNLPLDLQILGGDFDATEVAVAALTDAGRAFLARIAGTCAGTAPTAVTIRKSHAGELAAFAAREGLRVAS